VAKKKSESKETTAALTMEEKVFNHVRAGFGMLAINSSEEARTLYTLKRIANNESYPRKCYFWTVTQGMRDMNTGNLESDMRDVIEFIKFIRHHQRKAIFIMADPNPFLEDPVFIRTLKDGMDDFKSGKAIIFLAKDVKIPEEISHLVKVINSPLPNRDSLKKVIEDVTRPISKEPDDDTMDKTITALAGLTTDEAGDAISLSIVECGEVNPEIVSREKCAQLSDLDYIQVIQEVSNMENVGGMQNLTEWLLERREMFTKRARDYGLPTAKGILTIGVPGCGKSLLCKTVPWIFKLPLIRLDIGALMGGIVGESESNTRNAIKIAEAMAPVVLWIDELDKQVSTSNGDSSGTHEVTKRVMSSLLTWLQEKTAPVFIVSTANNIQSLAKSFPELLRKGRWDEIWYVDLPTKEERKQIFEIHIRNHILPKHPALEVKDFDIDKLAEQSHQFSGAEIEEAVKASMYTGFNRNNEPATEFIELAIERTVPQSKLSKHTIESLRDWAKNRARPASSGVEEELHRKIDV